MRGRWRPDYLDLMSSGYEGTPTPKAMGPTGRFKVRVVNLPRIEALSENSFLTAPAPIHYTKSMFNR